MRLQSLPSGGSGRRDEEDAARTITRILGDDLEWKKLSAEGRAAADSQYDPEVVGAALAAFLARS